MFLTRPSSPPDGSCYHSLSYHARLHKTDKDIGALVPPLPPPPPFRSFFLSVCLAGCLLCAVCFTSPIAREACLRFSCLCCLFSNCRRSTKTAIFRHSPSAVNIQTRTFIFGRKWSDTITFSSRCSQTRSFTFSGTVSVRADRSTSFALIRCT